MTSKNNNNSGSNVVPTRWNHVFAKNFTKRFKELDLKQKKLAEAMGVNESSIRNWKKGALPKGDYLMALGKHLKCSLDWLLNDEGPEPGPPGQKPDQKKPCPIYKVEELADRRLRVAAPDQEFDKHGGWKPRPEMKTDINRMLGFTYQILSSESIYSNALATNINAFYGALVAEKDLKDTKNALKIQVDEIESLKKICVDLYEKIAVLEKKADNDERLKNS